MNNRLELRYAIEWFPGEAGEAPEPLLVPDLRVDDAWPLKRKRSFSSYANMAFYARRSWRNTDSPE